MKKKITIRSTARRLIGGLRISCAAQGAVPVLLDIFGIEDVIMKYEYEMKFRWYLLLAIVEFVMYYIMMTLFWMSVIFGGKSGKPNTS